MKKVLILFTILTMSVFGKINDEMKYFNENDIKLINEKINEIENEKDVTIYVNTYSSEEAYVVDKSQEIVILNLVELQDKNIEAQLKFSKDIEIDDDDKNTIDEILDVNQKPLEENKFSNYVITVLDEITPIIKKAPHEEVLEIEHTKFFEDKFQMTILMLAFFVIFGIIIGVVKNKKKK